MLFDKLLSANTMSFRIVKATVSEILKEVYVFPTYMRATSTTDDLKRTSEEFFDLCYLPYVIGATNGKDIAMDCPKNKGLQYYIYHGLLHQVLLAFCDTKYRFTFTGVAQYGSSNHSAILVSSGLGKLLHYYSFNLPDEEVISDNYFFPTDSQDESKPFTLPYELVDDNCFSFTRYDETVYQN